MKAWPRDLAGRTKDLIDEVASADLIVMVASAGTNAAAAAVIAEACGVRKVMTTALIIESETKTDAELSKTLATPATACRRCSSSPTTTTTSRRCWRHCGREDARTRVRLTHEAVRARARTAPRRSPAG